MIRTATFSDDRHYRYSLLRSWDPTKGIVRFIGLNPSTADETEDDPTIRRCIGYARDWGFGGVVMLNIFAFRATDPKRMRAAADPTGPENDRTLRMWTKSGFEKQVPVIACWGAHGDHLGRGADVRALLTAPLSVFGLTKAGHPKHPLYLRKTLRPARWV